MVENLFSRAVVDRIEISVIENRDEGSGTGTFDVYVNGEVAGRVRLGLYYPPSIGVYGSNFAVWAGNRGAITECWRDGWSIIELDQPIHAIYRLMFGWCLVTELSVIVVDASGRLVSRAMHREVISSSRWEGDTLILRDFEGLELTVKIDGEHLSVGEIVPRSVPHTSR